MLSEKELLKELREAEEELKELENVYSIKVRDNLNIFPDLLKMVEAVRNRIILLKDELGII